MTDPQTFRGYAEEALSPTVFQGEMGARLMSGTIGLLFDMLAEGTNQSVKARFFGSNTFPLDALNHFGAERMMPRYPLDTDATYAARLRDAWVQWKQAGTSQAMIRQLALLGLTAQIKETFTAGWNWDGDTANWSRFWVVLTVHPWARTYWGDGGVWGTGRTWGSTATPDEARSVRSLVRKWKPAHMICPFIIVVFDSGTWAAEQPDGTWGDPTNRSKSAIYWPG